MITLSSQSHWSKLFLYISTTVCCGCEFPRLLVGRLFTLNSLHARLFLCEQQAGKESFSYSGTEYFSSSVQISFPAMPSQLFKFLSTSFLHLFLHFYVITLSNQPGHHIFRDHSPGLQASLVTIYQR